MADEVDVAVVGGGVSGLVCAHRLVDAGVSRVAVLEAAARVGGRTFTEEVAGAAIDHGGQWLAPGHTRALELTRDLGLTTFAVHREGESIYEYRGRRRRHRGRPPLRPWARGQLSLARARLDRAARRVPADAPWTAAKAGDLDSETLGAWIRAYVTSAEARELLRTVLTARLAAAPDQVSLLHALALIGGAGGFDAVLGAEYVRLAGGAQGIALGLAERLGRSVRTGTPVRAIEEGDPVGARVLLDGGGALAARRVVLALAPPDAARIVRRPRPAFARTALERQWQPGAALKVHAVYEHAFWRERGLSGRSIADDPLVRLTWDDSPPDGRPGVLMTLILAGGDPRLEHVAAAALDDPQARREAVLGRFAELFGNEAAAPAAYVEHDWGADPWVSGSVMPPPAGLLTCAREALLMPHGCVHYAGSETAAAWPGFIEGAVRAGERAAREVREALT